MPRDLLLVEVDGPTMKVKDSPSRVNPGFAACVVEVVLPVLRESFGLKRNKKAMLVIPCTKQKELYLFLSLKLRGDGWSSEELSALFTIGIPHVVISDIFIDTTEELLSTLDICASPPAALGSRCPVSLDFSHVKPTPTRGIFYIYASSAVAMRNQQSC
jgi:hypothetical protein